MKFDKLLKLFESTFLEKKDHLINKLPNLSPEEKTEIIDFYTKKNWDSNLEKMVDWSKKDLTYKDFEPVLNHVSKTGRKKAVKGSGISGLKEGEDYLELTTDGTYQAYRPLNYEASKLIASDNVGGCEGKWCTAYQKDESYWKSYIIDNVIVYIITSNEKYALLVKKTNFSSYEVFTSTDDAYYEAENIWINQLNNEKTEVFEFDKLMLSKFDQLISDNKNILSFVIPMHISYLIGNTVDLTDVTDKNIIREILVDSNKGKNIKLTYILPQDCSELFANYKLELTAGINWDTSNVTDMRYMFSNSKLVNPNTSNWKVHNVTSMQAMFNNAASADPDVEKWNVSKVTTIHGMFLGADVAKPSVTTWNVSEVKTMNGAFGYATIANPDVSKWNVSKVKDITFMFTDTKLANPDVSKWNVSKVKDLNYAFKNADAATFAKTDIENWMKYENISSKFETVDKLKSALYLK